MSAAKNRVRDDVTDESHIRRLVGLIGAVSGLDVDLPQKRRLILEGVSRLIQADGWSWSLTEKSGRKTVMLDALSGGEKGLLLKRGISRYLKELGPNAAGRSLGKKAGGGVGNISNSISDRSLKRGPVISIRELSGAVASHLCFVRAAGRPAFSAAEEEIVQILAEEIPWLHEVSPTCVSLQPEIHLSPREHEVFLLLGEGLKSKEISERLGISPHTVQDYVKSIYRAFGIRSRAEALKLVEVQIPQ